MKIYKVYLDMTLIISRLKKFRLYEYNTSSPIVFVEADDPDGACFKATYQLIRIILDQDNSEETKEICKDIKTDMRVLKVSTS
jgi:hypothetical protein|tara:strand:+ start:1832 stop:2080 length:249 start_codon:yes stop_codon:yes gene_type:complete